MKHLIIGIGGQDGSYLADILTARGDEVYGVVRHSSVDNLWRIKHLAGRIHLCHGDLLDPLSMGRIIAEVRPTVIYNEADQDNVQWSFDCPAVNHQVTFNAVQNLLAIAADVDPAIRVFQPLSATIFGTSPAPQNEYTHLDPRSPYAVAKAAVWHSCNYFRKVHELRITTGILYNHDSERRSSETLLQYLARSAISVARGESEFIGLGRPDMLVDIGHAREFMQHVVWLMLMDRTGDFVIGTGTGLSIRSLAEASLTVAGIDMRGRVVRDPNYKRVDGVCELRADCSKLKSLIGSVPTAQAEDVVRHLTRIHLEKGLPCV